MSSNEGNSPIEFFGSLFIIEENKEFQCIHGGSKKISKAREAENKFLHNNTVINKHR